VEEELEKVKQLLDSYDSVRTLIGEIAQWQNVGSKTEAPTLEVNTDKTKNVLNMLNISRENLAAIIQHVTELQVVDKIKELKEKYKKKSICLAGGIFANVLINKKIKELGFEDIYIHPAMGDDGLALGACTYYLGQQGVTPEVKNTAFFGPSFSDIQIEKALKQKGVTYYYSNNLEKDVAIRLSRGEIIARFNGRMEYGQRALGNRSILAPAINKDINRALNKKLHRTEFMPFAPISLEEDGSRLYKNLSGTEKATKFMTIAVDCTDICKKQSPATVHIDGTARPQLVGEENPGLRKILLEYKKITGLSSLINTSFNMHESPIVFNPTDAITAYRQSDLDCLAIGNFIVSKE